MSWMFSFVEQLRNCVAERNKHHKCNPGQLKFVFKGIPFAAAAVPSPKRKRFHKPDFRDLLINFFVFVSLCPSMMLRGSERDTFMRKLNTCEPFYYTRTTCDANASVKNVLTIIIPKPIQCVQADEFLIFSRIAGR